MRTTRTFIVTIGVLVALVALVGIPIVEAQQLTVNAVNTRAVEQGNSVVLTGELQVKNALSSTASGVRVNVAGKVVSLGDVPAGRTAVSSPFTITVSLANANSGTVLVPATIGYSVGGQAVQVPYRITYPLQ